MSTLAKYIIPKKEDTIKQGDIFKNIRYVYEFSENKDYVDITEFRFKHIIVLSQACDVNSSSEMILNGGKYTNFMISVLVAPIYNRDIFKAGDHLKQIKEKVAEINMDKENLFTGDIYKSIKNDFHYRFHLLKLDRNNKIGLPDDMIIDFKHYFTLNINTLLNVRENKRIAKLEQLFCEQVTLKFSNYLSRVAIP